jgi:murein DD-endopeptidase MepM/ murein hydrolase activator NlpD
VHPTALADGYGNTVVIDDGSGWQTLYAHLGSFDVRKGDCVTAASVIGKVGATGLVASPQIHFEVRRNGESVDPLAVAIGDVGESDRSRR